MLWLVLVHLCTHVSPEWLAPLPTSRHPSLARSVVDLRLPLRVGLDQRSEKPEKKPGSWKWPDGDVEHLVPGHEKSPGNPGLISCAEGDLNPHPLYVD